jgi:hypothetical protein
MMKKILIASIVAFGITISAQAKDIVDTAVGAGSFKTLATALGAGHGQLPRLNGLKNAHAVHHLLQKGQAIPGADLAGGEFNVKVLSRQHGSTTL